MVNAYNLCHAQLSYPCSYSCSIFVGSSSDGKPYSKTELTANLRRKKNKIKRGTEPLEKVLKILGTEQKDGRGIIKCTAT